MKLFSKKPPVTVNVLQQRLIDMEKVASSFICETSEHRQAKRALFQNMAAYQKAIDVFSTYLTKPGKRYTEYQRKRYDLAIECGGTETQLDGERTVVTGVKDTKSFMERLQKLNLEYKKEIRENHALINEHNQMMSDQIEDLPEPVTTSYSNFPDSIPINDLRKISFMITNDSD